MTSLLPTAACPQAVIPNPRLLRMRNLLALRQQVVILSEACLRRQAKNLSSLAALAQVLPAECGGQIAETT